MATSAPARDRALLGALQHRRAELVRIAARHGARDLRVFGSVARGEETRSSDVDLLVQLAPSRSLLDLAGLQQALARALGRNVDVVPRRGLSPHLRRRILKDARPL